MSEDSPFVGLEGSLREWPLRIDQLAQMASSCPEGDRAPLIVVSDYLQSAYIQLLFYQVEEATRPQEQEEGGAAGQACMPLVSLNA
jgi:hypothetical protein